MIFSMFRKRNNNRAIVERQYATLTSAARDPDFYRHYHVPDTVMGRLDMISIIMILFFRRTSSASRSAQELAQSIVDAFFEDIDHSIRELGVGDQSVPKRMKKLAGNFYGRAESYGRALGLGDEAGLAEALARNFYPDRTDAPDMHALASYMIRAEQQLATCPEEAIISGLASLPAPGVPAGPSGEGAASAEQPA